MSNSSSTQQTETKQPIHPEDLHWWRWTVFIGGLAAIVALFYAEENWRGKRVWQQCRRQSQAQGHALDWAAYIPAPVAEEENFFAAPNMAGWFAGRGASDLSARLQYGRDDFLRQRDANPELELRVFPRDVALNPSDVDLLLDYQDSVLAIPTNGAQSDHVAERVIVPLIVLSNAPFIDAIKNLAGADHLKFSLDPRVGFKESAPQPLVSDSWSNTTVHAVLVEILKAHDLFLVPDPAAGGARIVRKDRSDKGVYLPADVARQLVQLLQTAVAARTNGLQEPNASSPQKFTTFFRGLARAKPRRIIVRANKMPTAEEVEEFLSKKVLGYISDMTRAHVESTGTNSFGIWISPLPVTAAADYLAWSDRFEPDFDLIRKALKRPYARMDGNYEDPISMPIPNFVTLRTLAQTLAQNAQCELLLGRPEAALRELSLVQALCGILQAKPSGKPMTLVAAMIQVAIVRLHVGVVADGLRLEVWREPQLAAFQEQFRQINLLPFVAAAFETERASLCHVFETLTPEQSLSLYGQSSAGLGSRVKDPLFLFLSLAPRGWIYQNMASVATWEQGELSAFDGAKCILFPHNADAVSREWSAERGRFSPKTFLACNMLPNFIRAIQEAARAQTLANEALVACALERYRQAHGKYAQRLETLSPGLLEKIPMDIIGGRPLKYRLLDGNKFLFYSIGWNEKDDGGVPGSRDINRFDVDQGDWVWPHKERLIK